MNVDLPLREMSLADKLRTMEALWADLSREDSGFTPPEWHGLQPVKYRMWTGRKQN
ncbi:addiction module protein [Verrucomicrobia bacterium]|nr:addiction module protein [Verrucomicrobiota bacterium]